MKRNTVVTLNRPLMAKATPAVTMRRNPMLLMMFISGPMTPPKISALMPVFFRAELVSRNSFLIFSSLENAMIVRYPMTLSSTSALSSPSSFCCAAKYRLTRLVKNVVASSVRGIVTMLMSVISQL